MCADRRIADAELGADGGKPVPAYDLLKNARLSGGKSESRRKAPDSIAMFGIRIDGEDGDSWPVDVEDRQRAVGGKRKDIGESWQGVRAAVELEGSAVIAFASSRPRSRATALRQALRTGGPASRP